LAWNYGLVRVDLVVLDHPLGFIPEEFTDLNIVLVAQQGVLFLHNGVHDLRFVPVGNGQGCFARAEVLFSG